jgi:hypothetical protein
MSKMSVTVKNIRNSGPKAASAPESGRMTSSQFSTALFF